MNDAIVTNIIAILILAALGALFAPYKIPRWFGALWVANLAFWISVFGWVIFIAHHFLVKAW